MDKRRLEAANSWNDIQIRWLIEYMEKTKRSLERFEKLGEEANDLIDNYITELECLRNDYKME